MVVRKAGRKMLTVAILTALASVPMQAALAQDAATQADETTAEGDETTLSSIVVTAQKREEALQDVPISMTVLSDAAAAGHRRARHQGPAAPGARPDRHQHARAKR